MNEAIFDIETDGFYKKVTKIHCIVIYDVESGQYTSFKGRKVIDGIYLLSQYKTIIGHNIIQYDIPVIKKLYPGFTYNNVLDTYIMSLLFDPNRRRGHSLDDYGLQFNIHKVEHDEWLYYTPIILERCEIDVRINERLYRYFKKNFMDNHDWSTSLQLEQDIARIHFKQEQAGVPFNTTLAYDTINKIDREVDEMDKYLLSVIPEKIKMAYTVEVKKPFKVDGSFSKAVTDWFSGEEVCKV